MSTPVSCGCGWTIVAKTAALAAMAKDRHNCERRRRNPPRPALPILIAPGPWVDDALCAQVDPELWYPEKGESARDAKAICSSCPVQRECLEYALANNDRYGVYGGLSERERRRLKPRPVAA